MYMYIYIYIYMNEEHWTWTQMCDFRKCATSAVPAQIFVCKCSYTKCAKPRKSEIVFRACWASTRGGVSQRLARSGKCKMPFIARP